MNSSGIQKHDFSEKLLPSFPGLLPLLLVMPTMWLVLLPLLDSKTNLMASTITALLVLFIRFALSKKTVVAANQITFGSNIIEKRSVDSTRVLDRYEARKMIGSEADARALLHYSAAAKFAVLVTLDEGSKWPYCLISTNKPEALVRAIETF